MRTWIALLVPCLLACPAAAADLVVSDPVAGEHALQSVSVTDPATGAHFVVAFDARSESVARHSIPVLDRFYRQIAELVAVDPADVDWADVLFANHASELLLDRKEGQVLWRIDVAADGTLGPDAVKALYLTIPHEQVHATQGDHLPRWFAEGQAEWAGIQVTERWKPDLARESRAQMADALATSESPVSLASWGGIQPKMEAILRQLTPEQRAQFLEDPGSVPLRAMTFTADDLVSDESNTMARYAAALALFERMEAKAGLDGMQAWFKSARSGADAGSTNALVESAREATGREIESALD